MPVLTSLLDTGSAAFAANTARMAERLAEERALVQKPREETATKRDKCEKRGHLRPRERVARLLDRGSDFIEFALPGWWLAQRFAGSDLRDARPVRWMRKVDGQKVLVIHGDRDRVVPVQDAYALWAARPECDLWIVRGARHGGCYARDPERYLERVVGFLASRLKL